MISQLVANTIKNKVLVGHALYNDLSGTFVTSGYEEVQWLNGFLIVLGIPHPAVNTRDVG
jgi:hypothetical protein